MTGQQLGRHSRLSVVSCLRVSKSALQTGQSASSSCKLDKLSRGASWHAELTVFELLYCLHYRSKQLYDTTSRQRKSAAAVQASSAPAL